METTPNAVRRLILAGAVFGICYLMIYKVPFDRIPAATTFQPFPLMIAIMVCSAIAWFAWSGSKNVPAHLFTRVLGLAFIVSCVFFLASALSGPYFFPAKPTQGAHLGLEFWGPLGALIGGIAGLIKPNNKK